MKTYVSPRCRIKEISMAALYPIIQETLDQNGLFTLYVTGKSMSPFLEHMRDQVILAPLPERPIRRGDIVLYQRAGGQFVMHRVYGAEKNETFTLLGDAQWTLETGIRKDQLRAYVPKVIRKGKEINSDKGFLRFVMTLWMLRIRYPKAARLCQRIIHLLLAVKNRMKK